MKKYVVYQSVDAIIIAKEKYYGLTKDLDDFDYIGYLEIDSNEICTFNFTNVPYFDVLPLLDKIQSIDFSEDEQATITRTQLRFDWEDEK